MAALGGQGLWEWLQRRARGQLARAQRVQCASARLSLHDIMVPFGLDPGLCAGVTDVSVVSWDGWEQSAPSGIGEETGEAEYARAMLGTPASPHPAPSLRGQLMMCLAAWTGRLLRSVQTWMIVLGLWCANVARGRTAMCGKLCVRYRAEGPPGLLDDGSCVAPRPAS